MGSCCARAHDCSAELRIGRDARWNRWHARHHPCRSNRQPRPSANAGARPTTTPTKPNVAVLIAELERNRAVAVVKGDVAKLKMETADDAIFIDRNGKV